MKYNLILNITSSCNYNCSYCNVIKINKNISKKIINKLLFFIKNNSYYIDNLKFFGGEPLLIYNDIIYIINNSNKYIGNNYQVVTNTSLLNDNIGKYFKEYFHILFFSIDTENKFYYDNVIKFVHKYNLLNKLYFNLIIIPGKEKESLKQFYKLYFYGFRKFNILPVYYTKIWSKYNLKNFSGVMKIILDLKLKDKDLILYGFQDNKGKRMKLNNNNIFINLDGNIYYSDIICTYLGKEYKNSLYLGNIKNFSFKKYSNFNFINEKLIISKFEKDLFNKLKGQKELYKIMDYFSVYLNNK